MSDMSELKNCPLTGEILTAIALRAIGLFPRFYDVGALTFRTGHGDCSHLLLSIHKHCSKGENPTMSILKCNTTALSIDSSLGTHGAATLPRHLTFANFFSDL